MQHHETHRVHRAGWLRAAVMGANDGIVSTASLLIGVAAAGSERPEILLAGVAAMVAGAMSMAAGEYVSVSSQADIEAADLATEKVALQENPVQEQLELMEIYVSRGLTRSLAAEVASQLMSHDALGAHARDEIGILDDQKAKPVQAALSSAVTFVVGAVLPILVAWLVPLVDLNIAIALSSLSFLAVLGATAAHTGGAPRIKGAIRVCFWGALAMVMTFAVGSLFNVTA